MIVTRKSESKNPRSNEGLLEAVGTLLESGASNLRRQGLYVKRRGESVLLSDHIALACQRFNLASGFLRFYLGEHVMKQIFQHRCSIQSKVILLTSKGSSYSHPVFPSQAATLFGKAIELISRTPA